MFHVCSHLANGLAQRFSFLCPNGECVSSIPYNNLSLQVTFTLLPGTMFHQQLKICHWWFFVDCDSSEMFYEMAPMDDEEEQDAASRGAMSMSLPQSNFDFTRGQSLRRKQRRRRIPRRPQKYNRKKRFGRWNIDEEIDTIKKEILKMLSFFD